MDDQDVIVIDNRNAIRTMPGMMPGLFQRPQQARPPVIVQTTAQPAVYAQAPSGAVVYVRDPATGALMRESVAAPPAAAPMTSKIGALGTGTLIAMGAQLLAALLPLPAQPAPTGDIAKDITNGQLYAAAQAATWQRYERINTFASLIQRVV